MPKSKSITIDLPVKLYPEGEQMRVVLPSYGGAEPVRLATRLNTDVGHDLMRRYLKNVIDDAGVTQDVHTKVRSGTDFALETTSWKAKLLIEDGVLNISFEAANDPALANNVRRATEALVPVIKALGWASMPWSVSSTLSLTLSLSLSENAETKDFITWTQKGSKTGSFIMLNSAGEALLCDASMDYDVVWAANEMSDALDSDANQVPFRLIVDAKNLSCDTIDRLGKQKLNVVFIKSDEESFTVTTGSGLRHSLHIGPVNNDGDIVLYPGTTDSADLINSEMSYGDSNWSLAAINALMGNCYVLGEAPKSDAALEVLNSNEGKSAEEIVAALREAGLLKD